MQLCRLKFRRYPIRKMRYPHGRAEWMLPHYRILSGLYGFTLEDFDCTIQILFGFRLIAFPFKQFGIKNTPNPNTTSCHFIGGW